MNEETAEISVSWEESHPWLSEMTGAEEEDSMDEMVRYALDELRLA